MDSKISMKCHGDLIYEKRNDHSFAMLMARHLLDGKEMKQLGLCRSLPFSPPATTVLLQINDCNVRHGILTFKEMPSNFFSRALSLKHLSR